ncbi:SusC/RagA family TonB-linked outer membrane protein [Maribellus comscasis]|uniref:SusC/RagA family TonB-linked outer membrane protein n=1 Tax=Maribellus comscasis TaxID=2681766 RepID=A0A6I6K7Y6_9BACT|nr:TonB-dependent receptor [Maribellus comscasis]QGY46154.1 SusC/RagA family TonB-linked outer membrane protein [Maribellus comscasis]
MKKNFEKPTRRKCAWLQKLLKIMKLTFFLILVSTMLVSAGVYSQNTKLSLHYKDISVGDLLELIEEQTEFRFAFSKSSLNRDEKISINVKEEKLDKVLSVILNPNQLSYKIIDRYVVISDKNASAENKIQQSQITISGKVTDSSGIPLPGVTVVIKGTTNGTVTNADGGYYISNVPENATLQFSFVGMKAQEILVDGKATINVVLSEENIGIDEVVAIGYGTMRKKDITGAVSALKGDELEARPVANSALALQGVAPGLNIQNHGGITGDEDVIIRIRGTGTLNDSNPLVLVDGIPQSLSDIPANEIESISVLKDASSASIYGARAGNGVILVTTKRGIEKGARVIYDNYVGFQSRCIWPEAVSPGDYLRLQNEAFENIGQSAPYSEEWITNVENGSNPYIYPYSDWADIVFDDQAFQQNHSLNISAGSDFGKISLSANYLDQDAIIKNHNYKRYSFRLNSNINLNKKMELIADLMYRSRHRKGVGRTPEQMVQGVIHTNQAIVAVYPNDSYDFVGVWNPYALIHKSGTHTKDYFDFVGTIGLNYQLLNNLKIKGSVSIVNTFLEERLFRNKLEIEDYFTGEAISVGSWWVENYLEENRERNFEPNYNLTIDYDNKLFNNEYKLLLGFQEIGSKERSLNASRDGFYSNEIRELDGGESTNIGNGGTSSEWRLRSFFGRFNYSIKNKYLIEANVRYDGSSRFSKGNKYGLFPSFSAGWRISEENFFKAKNVISDLKLRASWGQLGNQGIPLYRNVGYYSLDQGYSFNDDLVVGAAQTIAPNSDITWETTTMTDIGIDVELWNGKVSFTGDYFWRKTYDILLELPIAPSIGIDAPVQNAGIVTNHGWELQANYFGSSSSRELKYSISLSLSDFINKIEDLKGTGPYHDSPYIWQEGYSINTLYGYKSLGLYLSEDDLSKYPTKINEGVTLGDMIYEDTNGDEKINSEDRVVIGNSDPRYSIGINSNISYKGFDFAMFWQGVLKYQGLNNSGLIQGPNWQCYTVKEMLDRYHPTQNPDGSMPKIRYGINWNTQISDFWIEDTSYLRLKNFQIGYSLNTNFLQKINISKLRFYIAGENQITFTRAKWVDPEFPSNVRLRYVPQAKSIVLGLNVTF